MVMFNNYKGNGIISIQYRFLTNIEGIKEILQKQQSYAMYRPSTFHIAQVVTDIPLTTIQVFLFSIVVYFKFGLQYEAGKFFIFCFTLIGATLATISMFCAFGNLSPSLYFFFFHCCLFHVWSSIPR
ncbi:hypothetical protein ACTFIZ_000294 [Dictyostelium cf. discoideum]